MYKEKLRYIASEITVWDFFGIPQSTYLAYSNDEKLRMVNEYYKKLVLNYFNGKNFLHFFA